MKLMYLSYTEEVVQLNARQITMLLLMSAIWGGSFVFMKFLVPIFGPFMTTSIRLISASVFLYLYLTLTKYKMSWNGNIKYFAIIGILNSAIPFVLYSFASLYVDASIEVVLNSTSPIFGAMYAYFMLHEKLRYSQIIGLIVALGGVAVVTSFSFAGTSPIIIVSLIACLIGASMYGLSGAIIKKYASHIEPKMMSMGSLLFAGLAVLPFSFGYGIEGEVTINIILLMIGFGVFGTAITYLMYYALIKEVGATKALTVTYLMPSFGVLWAYLFVDEIPTLSIYIGTIIILIGVYLTTKKNSKDRI